MEKEAMYALALKNLTSNDADEQNYTLKLLNSMGVNVEQVFSHFGYNKIGIKDLKDFNKNTHVLKLKSVDSPPVLPKIVKSLEIDGGIIDFVLPKFSSLTVLNNINGFENVEEFGGINSNFKLNSAQLTINNCGKLGGYLIQRYNPHDNQNKTQKILNVINSTIINSEMIYEKGFFKNCKIKDLEYNDNVVNLIFDSCEIFYSRNYKVFPINVQNIKIIHTDINPVLLDDFEKTSDAFSDNSVIYTRKKVVEKKGVFQKIKSFFNKK